ncbi:Mu transposase C-terminal domain-containing protein [Nocardia asiatica]
MSVNSTGELAVRDRIAGSALALDVVRANGVRKAWAVADAGKRALRAAAVERLVFLHQHGDLTSGHVRLIAETLTVTERTVWRWIAARRADGGPAERESTRFRIDAELRVRLAYWRGNASALHRELRAREREGGPPAPSLATVHRAIREDLTPGDVAGLREGEQARRKFDVFLKRPPTYRNAAWEGDHVEAPVEVEVEGRLMKPWVTWFVDTAHCVIMGVAITPRTPNREAILAALRASILRTAPYGPAGGIPTVIRIDQGKDFLSRTVADAMGAFAVRCVDLPGYTPYLKGTVEGLNGAVEEMLFAEMPRYTHAPTGMDRAPVDPDAPALTFPAFVAELLGFVDWWNTTTEHAIDRLDGRSPVESWLADPSPLHEIDAAKLWMFTLEDDRARRKITTKGVSRGRGRHYLADWMTGMVGSSVRLRYMPNHDHEVEVFDADTGAHLGSAHLSDQATGEQIGRVRRARDRKAAQLRRDLKAAEKARRTRYAAVTTAVPSKRLGAMTVAEVEAELVDEDYSELASLSRPNLIPHSPPAPGWVLPVDLDAPEPPTKGRSR